MVEVIRNFHVGPYVGQLIEVDGDHSAFLNELINRIIGSSSYDIDADVLEREALRAETDLRKELKDNRKPIGAFCYMAGVDERELVDFCKELLLRTALENKTICAIAKNEGITVADADVSAYKRDYRDQYVRTLLSEPDFGEEELKEAILTKKVLRFLGENNVATKKG